MTSSPYTRRWLLLGVISLAIAGLFSIVLVIGRSPHVAALIPVADIFHKSLIVHVNLSVLIWFLCMAGAVTSIHSRGDTPLLSASWWSMMLSVTMLTLAIADPRAEAVMSNYIPTLTSPIFFLGLALAFTSVLLLVVHGSMAVAFFGRKQHTAAYGHMATACLLGVLFFALWCFYATYRAMPEGLGESYYEVLYWAGGHVLQFAWMILQMFALAHIAVAMGEGRPAWMTRLAHHAMWRWAVRSAYLLCLVAAMLATYYTLSYSPEESTLREAMTWLMRWQGALIGLIILVAAIAAFLQRPPAQAVQKSPRDALVPCFIMSIVLALVGGAIAAMIEGQDARIPAHYHGSIVAVTIALMGLTYAWLPELGAREVRRWKTAYWQPVVLGIGQLLHITGLAWSGGYGALRKTLATEAGGTGGAHAALGLMGLGGLLAIIGGLMFVVVVWRAFQKNPLDNNP